MIPANIEIFCRRGVRAVHKHPDVHMVNKYARGRLHLAELHEHSIEVSVWARCISEHRFVDLLELQMILDRVVADRVIRFDTCSFEQMCQYFYKQFLPEHRVCRVSVEADRVEGATLEWAIP